MLAHFFIISLFYHILNVMSLLINSELFERLTFVEWMQSLKTTASCFVLAKFIHQFLCKVSGGLSNFYYPLVVYDVNVAWTLERDRLHMFMFTNWAHTRNNERRSLFSVVVCTYFVFSMYFSSSDKWRNLRCNIFFLNSHIEKKTSRGD